MNDYCNFYKPKNNIYIIENENGEIKKIIGKEEDKLTMNAIAILNAHKEINPLDIQEAIKDVCEAGLEKEVKE